MNSGKKSKNQNIAYLSFYGILKDILRAKKNLVIKQDQEKKKIVYPLMRRSSIKDIIESLGIPHTEIGLLKNKDVKIDFSYILKKDDNISIYPHTIPLDPNNYLFPMPLTQYKFIVDVNVGRLAKFLRMLGYDCAYNWKWDDNIIAEIAYREKRVLLSKDIQLLKRKKILWGKLIHHENPINQLKEVIEFFGLNFYNPFTRCLVCNEPLVSIEKKEILHRLEPKTKKYFKDFSICPNCDKIYWPGSHIEKMKTLLKSVISDQNL